MPSMEYIQLPQSALYLIPIPMSHIPHLHAPSHITLPTIHPQPSIFPISPHKPLLHILSLRLSRPLRRLVFPTLLLFIALFFGLVHGLGVVFGR